MLYCSPPTHRALAHVRMRMHTRAPGDMNDDVVRAQGASNGGPDQCLRKLIIPGPEEVRLAWSECALQGLALDNVFNHTHCISVSSCEEVETISNTYGC